IQSDEETVDLNVLAKMIQYFDAMLQPGGNNHNQYSVLIRVPSQQCTTQFNLDSVFNTEEVKNGLNHFKNNDQRRIYEFTGDSVSLTATKPTKETPGSKKFKYHSEYVLISSVAPNQSPLEKILTNTNNNQCVVLYTYNSPCIKKCITDANKNILKGLLDWKVKQTTGIKAFVFQEIWQGDLSANLEEQFAKIDNLVPLYRCVKNDNQMQCYKCGDSYRETFISVLILKVTFSGRLHKLLLVLKVSRSNLFFKAGHNFLKSDWSILNLKSKTEHLVNS
uniref:Uncharacterized protein n=1 Tax=Sinocyclocheilus anshuiensis TaxID=1608454 RepID=A0A671PC72_9TELE